MRARRGITGGLLIIIIMGALLVFGGDSIMMAMESVMFGNYPLPAKASEMKAFVQDICRGGEGDYKTFDTPPPYIEVQCEDCATLMGKATFRMAIGAAALTAIATDLYKGIKNIKSGVKNRIASFKAMSGTIKDAGGVLKWSEKALVSAFTKVSGKLGKMKQFLFDYKKWKEGRKLALGGGLWKIDKQVLQEGRIIEREVMVPVKNLDTGKVTMTRATVEETLKGKQLEKYYRWAAGSYQKTGNTKALDDLMAASKYDEYLEVDAKVKRTSILEGKQAVEKVFYTTDAKKLGSMNIVEKRSRLLIMKDMMAEGKGHIVGHLGRGTVKGYVAMTVGAMFPLLFYDLSDATSELQNDMAKILENNSTNVPVGLDRVIVVKKDTSAEDAVQAIVDADKPQVRASQGRKAFEDLVGEMNQLFTDLEDGAYAASHFTQATAFTPTYIVEILADGDTEEVVIREEHAERFWDDVDSVVAYKLDEMARKHPDDAEKILGLKENFTESWTAVLGDMGLSHDPWTMVVAGLAEPGEEMGEICALEAGYREAYVCDWYLDIMSRAVDIDDAVAEMQAINDDLLVTQGKVLAALRGSDCGSKTITKTENFPADDFEMEGMPSESYTNTVELAKCALRVNCDYDTKEMTSSQGCMVEALNLNEEGIKVGSRIYQLRGVPMQVIDYGQTYDTFGIQAVTFASGFISKGFGRGIGTLSAAINNCGTLGNKGMVLCFSNAISRCKIPALCSACYTVYCGIKVSCEPAVSGAIKATNYGDRVEVRGAVKPL